MATFIHVDSHCAHEEYLTYVDPGPFVLDLGDDATAHPPGNFVPPGSGEVDGATRALRCQHYNNE